MPKRIRICAVHEFTPGTRRVVEINPYEEALVLNAGGTVYAISNICPHEGAALERGRTEGTLLYCPLHQWGFDLTNGMYVEDARVCARTYTVKQHHDDLFLCLP